MSLERYEIRRPRPEDAPSLGRAHVRIWQEAYAGLMDADYLADLDPKQREARWDTIIATMPAGRRTLIAIERESGEAVGFITVDVARDEDPATPLELWAINLLAAHHGTGLAQALVDQALGDDDAYLWVVEGNERAQSFYRRNGFALDGGTKRDEELEVDELRMTRRR
ncbi:GNAT family N-acetyltransferase [Calidifontibacter terrae]